MQSHHAATRATIFGLGVAFAIALGEVPVAGAETAGRSTVEMLFPAFPLQPTNKALFYRAFEGSRLAIGQLTEPIDEFRRLQAEGFQSLAPVGAIAPILLDPSLLRNRPGLDLRIHMNAPGQLILKEDAAVSRLEFFVYSPDPHALNVLPNGLDLVIDSGGREADCLMLIAGERATRVSGTCVVAVLHAAPGARFQVYRNGQYKEKTTGALIRFSELLWGIPRMASKAAAKMIVAYAAQPVPRLTESDVVAILKSEVVKTKKFAGSQFVLLQALSDEKLLPSLGGEALVKMLINLSDEPLVQAKAIELVRDKLTVRSDEISGILKRLLIQSRAAALPSLLLHAAVQSEDIPDILTALEDAGSKVAALPLLLAQTGDALRADVALAALGAFNDGTAATPEAQAIARLGALRLLTKRVDPRQAGAFFENLDSAFPDAPSLADAQRAVVEALGPRLGN